MLGKKKTQDKGTNQCSNYYQIISDSPSRSRRPLNTQAPLTATQAPTRHASATIGVLLVTLRKHH